MARTELCFASGGENAAVIYGDPVKYDKNPFEEIMRKKLERDFESFLVSSETAKVEQRVRELERQGVISVNWNRIDNVPTTSCGIGVPELSPYALKIAKAFVAGLLTGIGLIMLLL